MSGKRPIPDRQGGRGGTFGWGRPGFGISLLLLTGCGYLGGGSPAFDLQRITLTARDEVTSRADLRPALLSALAARLAEDGRLRLVEPEQAQATLESRVVGLASEPAAFDPGDVARRFRVVLTLEVTLREKAGTGILLKETVTGEADYSAPVGITGTRAAEEEGIRRAVGEAAARAVVLLLEGF